MPHRRLIALPLLCVTMAVSAGCAVEIDPESIPVPFSVAPTPSESAGVPAYVCTAAYKILTDGAVRLAGSFGASGDKAKQGMRDAFTDMAAKMNAEAARTPDTELRQAMHAVADSLTGGAALPDPKTYVNGDFQTVGQKLDPACAKD